MNPNLDNLQSYPFEKLKKLKANCEPNADLKHINLSIGEPQHQTPDFIIKILCDASPKGLGKYPTTKGSLDLRQAITRWLTQRFDLPENGLDSDKHVLPVNGTREALFAFAQSVINSRNSRPLVLMPNPFYQIYEGAALLAGARPYFINSLEETNFQPDFDSVPENIWARCQLLYICSPSNPSGTVLSMAVLKTLLEKSEKHNFIIAADECYSELYVDESQAPVGLLQACVATGRTDFKRCMVFHSLSKRSNVPGLRSGFVAGDADIISQFLLYRTYHGCAMPLAVQAASIAAWSDETHVRTNRAFYRKKFKEITRILSSSLSFTPPPASFYLWIQTHITDDAFARQLFIEQNVTVLPGSFISRTTDDGINPGKNRIRLALVAELNECVEAARRICRFL